MKKRKIDPLEEIMSNPYYQLRDDYNYAEKVKGTISFGQSTMVSTRQPTMANFG